jgi:hypothetical protein
LNHPAGTGLFFSTLVLQQTKSDEASEANNPASVDLTPWKDLSPAERDLATAVEPISDTEERLRHGGWMKARRLVAAALRAAGMSRQRLDRFCNCGSGARIEVSPDGAQTRIRANYCGDRFCKPCQRARARIVRDNLLAWTAGKDASFLTLTRRDNGDSLTDAINHLYHSFAKLREQRFWKNRVVAGASFTEITRGKNRDHWHVHLHAIIVADFIPLEDLRNGWKQASGGSFKVDIKRIRDPERQIAYVADYATKGFSQCVLADPDALIECVVALRGRRLLATFGSWGRLSVEPGEREAIAWRSVGSLNRVANAAAAGEAWARGVFRSLGFVVLLEPDGIEFQRITDPPGQSDIRHRGPPDPS